MSQVVWLVYLPISEINFSMEHNIVEINYRKFLGGYLIFTSWSLVADAPKFVVGINFGG